MELVKKQINKKEKEILRIITKHPKYVPKLRVLNELDEVLDIYEHDIPFAKRYLIDSELIPMTYWDFEKNEIKSKDIPKLKAIAFDMEVYNNLRLAP